MRSFFILIAWVCCFQLFAQNPSFTSSNLPIVVITTNGGTIVDEPKINVEMGIVDNGPGMRNNITDPKNVYDGIAAIEIRGSTSQMFPKKQYGFELRAANGEDDNEQSLFGMPKDGDWILFAPYNDKTLMRDALSYRLARATGHYASRQQFCEVMINNEYMGVYVLLEKVKRGKNRVPIDKLEEDENEGDDVTGGYILKLDKTTGGNEESFDSSFPPPGNSRGQKVSFLYEYPKTEDITNEQKAYIKKFMNDFETAFAGDNYNDPVNGWTKYADMSSFIDYFIVNEVTKNPDAYRLSTFMYKQKDSDGGKLFMGPVWDFNLGFGNVNYCTQGSSTGLVIDFNSVCPDDDWLIPFWWQKLWADDTFRTALATRWNELRADRFSDDAVLGYIDSVQTVLDVEAQQRNFTKWPVIGTYIWPNYKYDFSSYDEEVDWMKDWITDRLNYLDGVFNFSIAGVGEDKTNRVIVNAFPNPFDHDLLFEYDIPQPGVTKIELFDVMGRRVLATESMQYEAGRYSTKANIVAPAGLYVYRVTHNGGRPVTGKVEKR